MHNLFKFIQIKKLKCHGIAPVNYDMRENLGYMVNISLAFFSRENVLPKKVIIWISLDFKLCFDFVLLGFYFCRDFVLFLM